MPISLSRYVAITSSVGAGNNVAARNLGALIITNNSLSPTGTVLNFTSAAAVGSYFGTASEEYLRAVFYFGWISKNTTVPNQLSFYFWNNNAATGSLIYGAPATYGLATFTAVSSGALTMTLGGFTTTLSSINLSSAANLAAVASTLQTAIRAYSAGGTAWTSATVAYSSTASQFTLTSGTTGADTVSIGVPGSGTDLGPLLGWSPASTGVIYSNGTAAQTITTNLTALLQITNNFGSFGFTNNLSPTLANVQAAATWNNALNPNMQFLYTQYVTAANASTWQAALATTGGVTLTLQYPGGADPLGAYHEMMPAMIMAATDYTKRNSAQNYMFQQFNATPTVTTDTSANIYDPLLINYYGQTQTAGQLYAFYQTGVMYGTTSQPVNQNIYANEVWFKDAIGASIMTLLLALSQIPASNQGQAMLLGAIQVNINQALLNGVIEPGKTLTNTQQLYITQLTGSANAWRQVQNAGYWVNCVISQYTAAGGITQYKATYTLVYSKDDTIRFISGSDIMI